MFDEFNCLIIVLKLYAAPVYPFLGILLLFFSEHMLIKLLLQLFICVVDV